MERWYALADSVFDQIRLEIGQIDLLLETYAVILHHAHHHTPDLVQITAIAAILHSFYNGVEHIFSLVAKQIDHNLPVGANWHRRLLIHMGQSTSHRNVVLSATILGELSSYLAFRHFFRHAYSFLLDWTKIKPLVLTMPTIWNSTKHDVIDFIIQQEVNG